MHHPKELKVCLGFGANLLDKKPTNVTRGSSVEIRHEKSATIESPKLRRFETTLALTIKEATPIFGTSVFSHYGSMGRTVDLPT